MSKAIIFAEVHADDFNASAKFDAEEWFKQASEEEIRELAFCDWGGDLAADKVAYFFEDKHALVKRVFEYLRSNPKMPFSRDTVGFECRVSRQDAARWLKEHRPELHAALVSEGVIDD